MSSPWDSEWSPSTRPWRQSLGPCSHKCLQNWFHFPFPFASSSFCPAATSPAYHPSTCALVYQQWWAPYWPTSTPTTPTPRSHPTMFLPRTDLLLQTLEWVQRKSCVSWNKKKKPVWSAAAEGFRGFIRKMFTTDLYCKYQNWSFFFNIYFDFTNEIQKSTYWFFLV